MKCINCEKEIDNNLEQCPYCGCHYPEPIKPSKPTPKDIDKSEEAKAVKLLIDAAVIKGYVTDEEREVILRTAKGYGLDTDITAIMINTILTKTQKEDVERKAAEERKKKEEEERAERKRIEAEEKAKRQQTEAEEEELMENKSEALNEAKTITLHIGNPFKRKITEEEPKVEMPKVEEPKVEEQKVETPVNNNGEKAIILHIGNPFKRKQEESKTIVCPNCGAPLKPGAKFCSKCGTKLI